ncbi:MAG: c-type cytochrome [Chloroflexi bacterium]|nr:c-type cytochrome [Chloroflexota bacterium]
MSLGGRGRPVWAIMAIVAAAVIVLGLSACEGGTNGPDQSAARSQATGAASVTQPSEKSGSPAAVVVVQAGQLQAAPAKAEPTGWDTKWSQLLGIKVVATFDSKGPDAWSPTDHPLVYVTAEGPGYGRPEFGGAFLSQTSTTPGLAIIDGTTRQAVASAHYPLDKEPYSENHGLGASMDGKWFYTQGQFQGKDALLVINARTLKVDKILSTRVHHARAFHDANTNKDLVLIDGWGTFFALDPSDDHRVVGAVDPANLQGSGYLGFVDPSGKWLFLSVRTGFSSEGGVAVVDLKDWTVKARINTEDKDPIWIAFSDTGKYAYVSGGHESKVAKIDMSGRSPSQWQVVGMTNAGTIGPYGLSLSWDEKLLVAVGKGEASHNQGMTVGLIKPDLMQKPPGRGWGADVVGAAYTGCLREDHGLLHPDPDANELWLSCNSSFENVIFDMAKQTVKARVPMPNGGSSHNGAFVAYNPDWTGELQSDTNGLHGAALQKKLQILKASVAAAEALKPSAPSGAVPADPLARGELIYQKTAGGIGCASCHGPDARGKVGPDIRGKTAAQIAAALERSASMKAVQLEPAEIDAVAAYLATLAH